jgi:RNA polymerase primary sigma factor
MYLKQMGQVPLLNREQEVAISKRIEKSESETRKILARFGFIPDAYLDMASRLEQGDERFDRLILDKKIESRTRYLKNLEKLREQVASLRDKLTETYVELRDPKTETPSQKLIDAWEKGHAELAKAYSRFYFKQRVTEDLVAHTEAFAVRSAALSAQIATCGRTQGQDRCRQVEDRLRKGSLDDPGGIRPARPQSARASRGSPQGQG